MSHRGPNSRKLIPAKINSKMVSQHTKNVINWVNLVKYTIFYKER